jgi:hypothetical protein
VVRIDRASSLAPGIYWIRVDQGGASVSTKVALLE